MQPERAAVTKHKLMRKYCRRLGSELAWMW